MSHNSAKLLEFLHLVGRLKKIPRTGWVLRNIKEPECVAGHMYRMGILTFLLDSKDGLDKVRCLKMALVHDLAECIVGDITPFCGVVQSEKHRRETEAMKHIAGLAGNVGEELFDLYKEYESQVTPEAKVVKELDRFDMVLQAFEYEKDQQCPHKLQEFFDSTEGKFTNPILSTLVDELSKQRKEYEEIGLDATSNLSTFST